MRISVTAVATIINVIDIIILINIILIIIQLTAGCDRPLNR